MIENLAFPYQMRVTATRWLVVDTRTGEIVGDYGQSPEQYEAARLRCAILNRCLEEAA